jgi:hypothetical protein
MLHRYIYNINNPVNWVDPLGDRPNKDEAGNTDNVVTVIERIEQQNPKASKEEILDKVAAEYHIGTSHTVRYVYTAEHGWIDMKHYFASANEAKNYSLFNWKWTGSLVSQAGGYYVEAQQCRNQDPSCLSYEDLPSNAAGRRFYRNYYNNNESVSSRFKEHMTDLETRDYKDTRNSPSYLELPQSDYSGGTSGDTDQAIDSANPGSQTNAGAEESKTNGNNSGDSWYKPVVDAVKWVVNKAGEWLGKLF